MVDLPDGEKGVRICLLISKKIHERDGRTDRKTDRWTDEQTKKRTDIARQHTPRGKNYAQ